jgi:uncharacterized protein
MAKIVVFGAGGKAGRAVIDEATRRGHQVTAVVRDPNKYADLGGVGVAVAKGDVLDANKVAEVADGHDVAISAVAIPPDAPRSFYVDVTQTLLDGLAKVGVGRLLIVGGAASLEVAPGARLLDTPDFPAAWKASATAHADSLDFLRGVDTPVDWVYVSPAAFFDADGPRTGAYRTGTDQLLTDPAGNSHISYADYAIALVDEIETPHFHHQRITFAD